MGMASHLNHVWVKGRAMDSLEHIFLCSLEICVGGKQGSVHKLRPWHPCIIQTLAHSQILFRIRRTGQGLEAELQHSLSTTRALTFRQQSLKDVRRSKLLQHPCVTVFLYKTPVKVKHHENLPERSTHSSYSYLRFWLRRSQSICKLPKRPTPCPPDDRH